MCAYLWQKVVSTAAAELWRGLSVVKVRIRFGQPKSPSKVGEL